MIKMSLEMNSRINHSFCETNGPLDFLSIIPMYHTLIWKTVSIPIQVFSDYHHNQHYYVFPFFNSIMPGNYYFLVGSVSFIAGLYIDQNYNVPDIKYWVKHTEDIVSYSMLLLNIDKDSWKEI